MYIVRSIAGRVQRACVREVGGERGDELRGSRMLRRHVSRNVLTSAGFLGGGPLGAYHIQENLPHFCCRPSSFHLLAESGGDR